MAFRESEEAAQRKGVAPREGVARTQVQGTTWWQGLVPACTPRAPGRLLARAQGLQALLLETQPECRGAAASPDCSVSWAKGRRLLLFWPLRTLLLFGS